MKLGIKLSLVVFVTLIGTFAKAAITSDAIVDPFKEFAVEAEREAIAVDANAKLASVRAYRSPICRSKLQWTFTFAKASLGAPVSIDVNFEPDFKTNCEVKMRKVVSNKRIEPGMMLWKDMQLARKLQPLNEVAEQIFRDHPGFDLNEILIFSPMRPILGDHGDVQSVFYQFSGTENRAPRLLIRDALSGGQIK